MFWLYPAHSMLLRHVHQEWVILIITEQHGEPSSLSLSQARYEEKTEECELER